MLILWWDTLGANEGGVVTATEFSYVPTSDKSSRPRRVAQPFDHLQLRAEHFDWKAYSLYNSDLPDQILSNKHAALKHFLQYGLREGRLARRLRVVLRYNVQQGFVNQLFCHIPVISLAINLNAEVILASSLRRGSFKNYEFNVTNDWEPTAWSAMPLSEILDVQQLKTYWAQKDVVLHAVSTGTHSYVS